MTEIETLEQGLSAIEAQRALLGDTLVDTMLALARDKLAALKTAQTPPVPAADQRKHVTVLFADVSGSTALFARLDAEDVATTMNTLWHRLDAAITAHGGRIDKHIGDAVMALWGTDTASEDDPERAIKAALAMQAALAQWHAEHEPSTPIASLAAVPPAASAVAGTPHAALKMRIGLNTGLVLLGAVGSTGEFTAMGDTVNVASRLEHAAPADGILIAYDTYRHVRGVFDVQQLPPLLVKGKAEPLTVYLVLGAKPRTFRLRTRGVEGLETRTIGRTAELHRLQSAWRVVLTERRAQAALVSGEAGVGKSRVLYELLDWLEATPNVADWAGYAETVFWLFRGRARAEYAHAPYALLRAVFMGRFEIFESDSLAVARDKLTRGLVALTPDDPQAALKAQFIGQLLGFDFSASPAVHAVLNDPKQIRDRAFLYTEQLFSALSQRYPIVLMLEDLHWADDDSLLWLAGLLRATTAVPMLTVALARPTFFERRPTWRTDSTLFPVQVALQPLSEDDSRALVAEILRYVPALPDILRELIVSRAEGNPFYVEELIKMLIDQHVLVPNADSNVWRVDTTRLIEAAVPPTLTGVLQARLDRLTPAERVTLQRASAIGRNFWEQAVEALSQPSPDADNAPLTQLLTALVRKELIFVHKASTFADTAEYRFKHALLRDVTYETVLKPQRRLYHALAARWLAARLSALGDTHAQDAGRADSLTGLIATHYEQAGQEAEAATWYARAGAEAQAAYANATAQTYYARLLPLLTEPHQQVEILLKLGAVHELTGQWAEAEARYRAALALAGTSTSAHDPTTPARCQHALGVLCEQRGDYDAALAWLAQARATYATLADQAALAHTLTYIGRVYWRKSEYAAARSHTEHALALARAAHDQRAMALALNHLGNVTYAQGDYPAARALYAESLALKRTLGDKSGIATTLNNLGVMASDQDDHAAAQALHAESLALAREMGDKQGIALTLNNLGVVAQQQGDYAAARTLYAESLALKRELGDKRGITASLNNLGVLATEQGDYTAAHALHAESLALRQEMGDKWGIAASQFNLGLIAVEQSDYATARALHSASLTEAHAIGEKHLVAYNLAQLAAVALAAGDAARATRLAAAADTRLTALHDALEPVARQRYTTTVTAARAALAPDTFAAHWAQGAQMADEEASAEARPNL